MIDFWVMSNFGLVVLGAIIILYSSAFFIFKYLKTKITKRYILTTLRVILVLLPLYLVVVWVLNAANVNGWPHELITVKEKNNTYYDCRKKCQLYIQEKNPWLFETKDRFVSNGKVFENKECLGLFMQQLYSQEREATYQIYEQVEEIKTVRDNGFVDIKPVGKNLIMTIEKEPKTSN